MDWLEFVASLVDSLAWPAVAIVAVVALREGIVDLLARLQRAKYRDGGGRELNLDFGEEVSELRDEANLANIPPAAPGAPVECIGGPPQTRTSEAAAIVERAPTAAVLVAFSDLEMTLRAAVTRAGLPVREHEPLNALIHAFVAHGQLDKSTAIILNRLRRLRNEVAHGREASVSVGDAMEYVRLVERVRKHLEG